MITRILCWLMGCEPEYEPHLNIAWEYEQGDRSTYICRNCKRSIKWKALGGWERVK